MSPLTFNLIPGTQLYSADCGSGEAGSDGPQVFYLIESSAPPPRISLLDSWRTYQGYYVFVEAGVTDPAAFARRLLQYLSGEAGGGQGFLWVFNPNDSTEPLNVIPLSVSGFQTTPATFNFRNNILVVGYGCAITADTQNNRFVISQPSTDNNRIYLQVNWGGATLTDAVGSTVYIPLCGAGSGCLQFQASLIESYLDGTHLDAALRYFIDDNSRPQPGFLTSQRYPLLSLAGGSLSLMVNLNPLDPTDASRSYFSFTEQAGGGTADQAPIGSYFRTNAGLPVMLAPQPNARFVFAPNPQATSPDANDPLYLVPSGDFLMSSESGAGNRLQGGNAPHGPRLICGIGGNEYFDLLSGGQSNILSFTPGNAAYVPGLGSQQAPENDPLQGNATTSWITVKPAPTAEVNYYAQPQNAELYAEGFPSGSTSNESSAGDSGARILGFLEVAAIGFTAGSPVPLVPLAPYAGIEYASISPDAVQRIETGVLAPFRRTTLGYGANAAAPIAAPPAPNSTTPQGLLANVSGSNWNSLLLGQSSDGSRQFLVNVASSNQLQQALQTNQQFIVVTDLKGVAYFQSQISIGGWTFDFSTQPKPPAGDYYNVLIFKYYSASIKELAAATQMWTNPSQFNAKPSDVSTWLGSYIQDAENQVSGGNTRFQSFVDLVNDGSWNGVLGLNVYIPPGELPPEVQGLLGGIDLSKFSAHHFGIETNSVGSGFTLTRSSLFALISYDNTSSGIGAPRADGDYSFKVLTLQVVFANSEVTDFNSQIQVTINNLFDVGANLEGGKDNSVVLQGTYESHNGASTYSFTAAGTYTFKLDSDLITDVTFTKVQFTTVSAAAGGGDITSTFAFWGSIKFGTLAGFDFFSFDDLAFAGLSLSFTFNTANIGGDNLPIQSFTFDPGDIRFDVSISKARQQSLLEYFPLRLTGFTYASGGVSISDLGYVQVASPIANLAGDVTYALMFELDLGSIGALASPLKGFAADLVAGWNPQSPGKVAFGVKLPESSGGKLQIGIQGVLLLTIQNFEFTTLPAKDSTPQRYVLYMRGCTLEMFGATVPSSGSFSFVFFAPTEESASAALSNLGWFVAYAKGSNGAGQLEAGDGESSTFFALSYLGLGQRVVVPGGLDDANTVSGVLDAMASKLTPDLTGDALNEQLARIYDSDAGWIVGGEFTILETITLGAVYYDPSLYGLLAGIAKGKLGPLGGFNFEILYKKVTDTIGVYQIQLTLPDSLRQLQFGEVSITIPVIGIDIYTNGNFKIDVGFPNGTDFSNSLTIQVFPFIGAGGFYYARLSSGTATDLPAIPQGAFDPVLEFGFGLSLGVGKTINVGILSAGVSVTFAGILEGTVAYWVPPNQSSSGAAVLFNKAPDYYAISGQVAIVGTLYGVVDFGIVKASLTVTISAGATLTWQAYQDLSLSVYARVSVSLEVVIGGFKIFGIRIEIKIRFSFSASISYTWTFPDNRIPPWSAGPAFATDSRFLAGAAPIGPIQWNSITINTSKVPVVLYFSPQVTVAIPPDADSTQAQFVALLTMNTTAASGPADFDNLASALLAWAVTLYAGLTSYNPGLPVTADGIQALNDLLSTPGASVNDGPAPLNYSNISNFLFNNFAASLQGVPEQTGSTTSQQTTVFPMIPDLSLSATGQPTTSYSAGSVAENYLRDISDYFAMLLVNFDPSQSSNGALAAGAGPSMPTVIFQDFFALVITASISQAYQTMTGSNPPATLGALLTSLQQSGGFVNVAGQASRFLLHGLQLPEQFNLPRNEWANLVTEPLYWLTRQQSLLEPIGVNGSVSDAAPMAGSFNAEGGLAEVDGFYVGYSITFLTGALSSQTQTISGYTAAAKAITVAQPFTAPPANSDKFLLAVFATSSVAAGGETSSTFTGAGLPAIDNYFVDYILTFTGGALNGLSSAVTAYVGAALQITVSPAFPSAPATGDAFEITPYAASLSVNTNPAPQYPWFTASATNPPAAVLAPGAIGTIQSLVSTKFAPKVTVAALPNLSRQPKNFALQRTTPWQLIDDSGSQSKVIDNWTILPFPSTLMDQLADEATPLPELLLMAGTAGSNDPPIVPTGLAFNWATLVNLSVQQIPTTGGAFLTNTYQVNGTDETGRNLLYQLLVQLGAANAPAIDNIYLLFQPRQQSQQGLVSETIIQRSSSVLMKVNLTTESAPPSAGFAARLLMDSAEPPADAYNAMIDQYAEFLRLVWECSIVNAGGYYLYYLNSSQSNNGLPAYLFSAGTTAAVTLLVTFKAGSAAANFNNAAVITNPGQVPANPVFFAQASNMLDWRPTIAAGSVAFSLTTADPSQSFSMPASAKDFASSNGRVTRDDVIAAMTASNMDPASAEFAAATAENDLLTMFNLLTYRITNNGAFNTSIQGLPVGPIQEDGNPDNGTWNYQQGVSVYPWCNTGGAAQNKDPYAGVGNKITLSFELLDIFGNEMPSITPLPALTTNYLYFDDLIPVTSWTGVRVGYLCTTNAGVSTLEVNLTFEPSVFQTITSSSVSDPSPTSGSFKGASSLSSTDGAYVNGTIQFNSGALAGQSSVITAYIGATREITVSPGFSGAPANDDGFTITVWNQQQAAQSLDYFELIGYQLGGQGVGITLTTSLAPTVTATIQANQFTGQSGFVTGITSFLEAIAASNQKPPAPEPLVLSAPITLADREANPNNIFEVTVTLTVARESSLVDPSVNTIQPGVTPPLPLMVSSPIPPRVGNTATTAVAGSVSAASFNGGPNLSSVDGFYTGGVVTFTSGRLTGQTSSVTEYTGATKAITVAPAFTGAPVGGDAFTLTPKMTLAPFAQEFEAAFTEMRAATGLGSAGPLSVWAVRIATIQPGAEGITVAVNSGNPVFFAPKPLSNTLLSRPDANHPDPVMVMPYVSGQGDQPMIPMNFAGVDLDVFARGFLLAIDQFLSPAIAVPARQLNAGYYLAVITAKEALADAIKLGVTTILETNGSVSGAASTTSFNAAPGIAPTDGSYAGSKLTFTSGSLVGANSVTITSYTAGNRQITVSPALPSAPNAGDAFRIDPGSAALSAAQEAFKQRLLVTLSSNYNVSSVVQYPVSVSTTGTEEPVAPNLYGQIINAAGGSSRQDVALSTAKIALSTPGSLLTFLFDSSVAAQASAQVNMQYQVTHVEHEIAESGRIEGYTSSSWLTLITSPLGTWPAGNSMPVGETSIPIPLRAYPTPPSLLQQAAVPGPSEEPVAPEPSATLASQRLWRYECQYQQMYIAQDTVGSNILFNVPPAQQPRARLMASEPDLFDWLARFSYEYPLIQSGLAKIPAAPHGDPVATFAMQRFAELVWGAAFGTPLTAPVPQPPPPYTNGPWARWVTGGAASPLLGAMAQQLTQYQYSYQIEENPADGNASIELIAGNSSYPFPDIKIEIASDTVTGNVSTTGFNGGNGLSSVDDSYVGSSVTFTRGLLTGQSSVITAYTGASRTISISPALSQTPSVNDTFVINTLVTPDLGSGSATYAYANPNPSSTLVRTLVFNKLDVMSTENAWGGVQLARNKFLVSGAATNPEFVYQTPIVRFVNIVTPMIDSTEPVNIAEIQPVNPATTLEYYLCVMFKALFAPSGSLRGGQESGSRTIRVGCTYGYDILASEAASDSHQVIVTVPVLHTPPFEFNLSTDVGSDCTVAPTSGFVCQLGQAIRTWFSGYNPSTTGGVFTFDMSVFAGLSQTNLPVLRLRDLFLRYDAINPPL